MEKPFNWSYSHLREYERCPRKYEVNKILKLYPFEQSEEAKYGDLVHKAIEDFVGKGTPIPEKFKQFRAVAEAAMRKPGRKIPEMAMGITRTLGPCGFFDKQVWARGKADLVIIDDDNFTARIIDWKTGSNKYPDLDQMELMSLMLFTHEPHIRVVKSALIYIVKDDMKTLTMTREQAPKYWQKYIERVARIEAARAEGVFNPKQGPLCGWCPHKPCEHHPKHHGG